MAEYIKRIAAMRAARHAWGKGLEPSQYIEIIPAADVVPVVHGRWEAKGYVCGESEFECSACHETEWRTSIGRFRWCPFCGARMDGDTLRDVQYELRKWKEIVAG